MVLGIPSKKNLHFNLHERGRDHRRQSLRKFCPHNENNKNNIIQHWRWRPDEDRRQLGPAKTNNEKRENYSCTIIARAKRTSPWGKAQLSEWGVRKRIQFGFSFGFMLYKFLLGRDLDEKTEGCETTLSICLLVMLNFFYSKLVNWVILFWSKRTVIQLTHIIFSMVLTNYL